jgi:predicted branched-subunit amino acid permease
VNVVTIPSVTPRQRTQLHATRVQPETFPATFIAACTIAALNVGAGAVHFSVAPDHFHEWMPFGVFFTAIAFSQIAWAVGVLWSPRRETMAWGTAATATIVALWVVTRTVGLPVGPQHWTPEPWGRTDGICAAFEIAAVAFGLAMLQAHPRTRVRRRPASLVVAATVAAVIGATSIALSPIATGSTNAAGVMQAMTRTSTPPVSGSTGRGPLNRPGLTEIPGVK